jgi:hypothetical protein
MNSCHRPAIMYDPRGSVTGATPPSHAEGRAATRRQVAIMAELRDRSSTRHNVEILDLSATGFRCIADYSLDPGTTIWIKLPGLSGLEATVAWRRGDMIGAAFLRPLYPAVFEHIVRQAGGTA